MQIFFGYFVWGVILAAPFAWIVWRFRLQRFLPGFVPRFTLPERRHTIRLPPQLSAVVIRGVRHYGKADSR
ncbi:hypothetical protein [Paraburkholderia caballeronis]|uniref:Uncharacterized protein n=1 Tax=Paraburkholderia caballeronis TaxID=416943 RepID=A0A1H7LDS9_9BURK|nr:hypothetical protein [Paraburkholderia caballeronis]PXW28420.1 hypothetical protein C7403_102314 [Paraburkholderia caballeronis]PXX03786.1 hypothetical protein C7407_102314 [Paraburkholderia caballeronis]RAK04530.1 hypothetical protein C7409_102314 [Paraburkholderia caballeronis]TDV19435.1 hypothetical protein C7408_102180 [Paraburkholderia caballeronis]TDV22035.1 hypothetical protein C7406_101180 [Paraburkholderia caballeronis]